MRNSGALLSFWLAYQFTSIERFHHVMKLLPTPALRHLGVQVVYLGSHTTATVMSESYITTLSAEAKTIYEEKIKLIGGLDPYSSNLGKEIGDIPPVDVADMLSYLVLQTSYLTSQQF